MATNEVYDLFSGMGGWGLAAAQLGIKTLGFEKEKWPCETQKIVGLDVVKCDLVDVDAYEYDTPLGIVASPPCQPFSRASTRYNPHAISGKFADDHRRDLISIPFYWTEIQLPPFIIYEQVRGAKEKIIEIASELEFLGYSVWNGLLNSADYGVPQARKRIILLASRTKEVFPPEPTVEKHITMAEALPHRDDLPDWAYQRPSPTIVGTFKPEVIQAPGWRLPGSPPRQNTPNSAVCSFEERLVLQGFPPHYPVQGSKTSRSLQIGNAIPPPLAKALLEAVI